MSRIGRLILSGRRGGSPRSLQTCDSEREQPFLKDGDVRSESRERSSRPRLLFRRRAQLLVF